jgi:hypothetical protein
MKQDGAQPNHITGTLKALAEGRTWQIKTDNLVPVSLMGYVRAS